MHAAHWKPQVAHCTSANPKVCLGYGVTLPPSTRTGKGPCTPQSHVTHPILASTPLWTIRRAFDDTLPIALGWLSLIESQSCFVKGDDAIGLRYQDRLTGCLQVISRLGRVKRAGAVILWVVHSHPQCWQKRLLTCCSPTSSSSQYTTSRDPSPEGVLRQQSAGKKMLIARYQLNIQQ
jgi:hypothetical protein